MEAEIYGEDEEVTGLRVTDNAGVEHTIQLERDGTVYAHHQEGYPDDPADRSPEGNERVNQARRFAQFYLHRERGYDTLPTYERPDRINAVRVAVRNLDDEGFEEAFGPLYQQLRSHSDPDVDPPVVVPDDAADPDTVLYRQHVHVGLDPTGTAVEDVAEELAAEYGLSLDEASLRRPVSELSAAEAADWRALGEELGDVARERDLDLTDQVRVAGVSGIQVVYRDADGEERETPMDDPTGEPPDARVELASGEVPDLETFRGLLDRHLGCQIRDCYVVMGVVPPEPVRVLGPGRRDAAGYYESVDMYPNLHDMDDGAGAFDRLRSLFS